MAASRIGRMYDKIFKISSRAHSFYRKAYQLGMSLQPRDVSSYLTGNRGGRGERDGEGGRGDGGGG